jgi:hypothetical protein
MSTETNIYDVTGRLVRKLAPSESANRTSTYEAYWDRTNLEGKAMSPGVYFVRVASNGKTETARITVAK